MSDKIDAAIAAAAEPPARELVTLEVGIAGTGQPTMLVLPIDLTEDELLELVAWMAAPIGLRRQLEAMRGAVAGRIIVPRSALT